MTTRTPTANGDYERIAAAIAFVRDHAREQPALDDVAAHLGLSAPHTQRLFKRFAGVSPKRFLQQLTVEAAKEHLRASQNVLTTSFDVGLSGGGRLHDLFVSLEAMTPGEFKAGGEGLTIAHGVGATPLGPCRIAWTARGICHVGFVGPHDASLSSAWPAATWVEREDEAQGHLTRLFADVPPTSPILLHVRGTNWQVQVWRALLRIPEGHVVSYADLARYLDRPRAARAVASAVAHNPIAYWIPCHRVLRQNGALSGYRWGPTRKQALLAREWSRA